MDTFKILQELYDKMEEVILINKDMKLNMKGSKKALQNGINELEIIYNELKGY